MRRVPRVDFAEVIARESGSHEVLTMNRTRAALLPLAMSIAAGTAFAHPPWYTVTTIGPVPGQTGMMYPKSINNLGQVVGWVYHTAGAPKAFIWLPIPAYGYPSGFSILNNLGGLQSEATGINDAGQVSGSTFSVTGQSDIARWNLAASAVPEILFNPGFTTCINSLGVIGGNGIQPTFSCNVASVFSSAASNAMVTGVECANSRILALNTAGMAVGVGFAASNKGFIAYPPSYAAVELVNFPGVVGQSFYTSANDVNSKGQVAGYVHHPTLGSVAIRFQDLNGNGIPDPATEYTILSTPASGSCNAIAINASGTVGGVRASDGRGMLWQGGKEVSLNNAVFKDAAGLPFVRGVIDISDTGLILCAALTTAGEQAVILRPMCYANCDGVAGITGNDFQCFMNRFAEGSPYANCDKSTGTPALTANDFMCFLSAAVGCP